MRNMVLVAAIAAFTFGVASADEYSAAVQTAYKGKLVISKDEVEPGKTDKQTVDKLKAGSLSAITGEIAADVTQWHFHYAAFLSRTGATSLKIEFVTDDAGHRLAADKQLEGLDPKSSVITGDITIDEDEGVAVGKTYVVEVVAGHGDVVAKTTITFSAAPKRASKSLYDRIGGKDTINAVVWEFIANISVDPKINARFADTDIKKLKATLVDQFCVMTGGPCKYTGKSMADAHKGMKITDDELSALLGDLKKALDKFKVGETEQKELLAALAGMKGDIVGK
jgi:hemoglobin